MAFLSTLILGIVAAIVGSYLQYRSWRHRYFTELRDRERADAMKLLDDLSQAIDRRLTVQRSYVSKAIRSDVQDADSQRHREALDNWMGSFSSFKARIGDLFGYDTVLIFENSVHKSMRDVSALTALKVRDGLENLSAEHRYRFHRIEEEMSLAHHTAYRFLRELNGLLANGSYGRSQYINDIKSNDLSLLTKSYLLRRLLALPDARF